MATKEEVQANERALAGVRCPVHGGEIFTSRGFSQYFDRFTFEHRGLLYFIPGGLYRDHGADLCRDLLTGACRP